MKNQSNQSLFLRFSIIGINLLIRGSIKVNIRQNNEKNKKALNWSFSSLVNLFLYLPFFSSETKIKEVTITRNFEFLRENGMFGRAKSLFMMKSLFIKIFCAYDGWRLTEMTLDTPAKRRGKL